MELRPIESVGLAMLKALTVLLHVGLSDPKPTWGAKPMFEEV